MRFERYSYLLCHIIYITETYLPTYACMRFVYNQCMTFSNDVVYASMSFLECEKRCNNISMCKSVSYNNIMSVCIIHMQEGTSSHNCTGYLHSQKAKTFKNQGTCYCHRLNHITAGRDCPTPDNVRNGKLLGNGLREGNTLKVICKKGYLYIGGQSIICDAGQWSGEVNCVEDPSCNQYMVSGEDGVSDDQLSESSNFCSIRNTCGANPKNSVTKARLNTTGPYASGWAAGGNQGLDYIQVDFLSQRIISAVALQGNAEKSLGQWVTGFKLLLSDDCLKFRSVKDENGSEKIFDGTTGSDVIVIRPLPERMTARCVRLQPTSWNLWPALRFDVLGCS